MRAVIRLPITGRRRATLPPPYNLKQHLLSTAAKHPHACLYFRLPNTDKCSTKKPWPPYHNPKQIAALQTCMRTRLPQLTNHPNTSAAAQQAPQLPSLRHLWQYNRSLLCNVGLFCWRPVPSPVNSARCSRLCPVCTCSPQTRCPSGKGTASSIFQLKT